MAISVTAISVDRSDTGGPDPDSFLDDIGNVKVRLSDLTDEEDDSLVSLTDVMAYSMTHDSLLQDYLVSLLDSAFGTGRYQLTISYEGEEKVLGRAFQGYSETASRSYPISIGGSINIKLSLI